jgi:hypothetical protein
MDLDRRAFRSSPFSISYPLTVIGDRHLPHLQVRFIDKRLELAGNEIPTHFVVLRLHLVLVSSTFHRARKLQNRPPTGSNNRDAGSETAYVAGSESALKGIGGGENILPKKSVRHDVLCEVQLFQPIVRRT